MIYARLCFDDFHTFLLAQLSKYLADIFFDLSIYLFASVLRRKNDVILASILRVRCAFDLGLFCFIEHDENLLDFLCNAVAKPFTVYHGGFVTYTKVLYLPPVEPGVYFHALEGAKNEKNAGKPAFFGVHLFCTHYVVEAMRTMSLSSPSVYGYPSHPRCQSRDGNYRHKGNFYVNRLLLSDHRKTYSGFHRNQL